MNYDDGYWITNLYTAKKGRWYKIQGRLESHRYPIYTRFTNRPNRVPVTPKAGRHPFAPDLSNAHPTIRGQLIGYKWANVNQSEDIQLNVQSADGQRVICEPVSWYSTFSVVVDDATGRRIASLSATEKTVKTLLDEIIAKKYEVRLYGQRRVNKCSSELLWAQPRLKEIEKLRSK